MFSISECFFHEDSLYSREENEKYEGKNNYRRTKLFVLSKIMFTQSKCSDVMY